MLQRIVNSLSVYYLEILAATIAIIGVIISLRSGQSVELLGIVISVIALLISLRDGRELKAASAKANEEYKSALILVHEYSRLVREYRGQILDWEEMVNEVARQISSETESIMMALDILTYGAVTVPDAHRKFWAALLASAASQTPLKIVTFNGEAITQMIKEQFGPDMASSPTENVTMQIQAHFEHVSTLLKEGKGTVSVGLTNYFPLHLFIFGKNGTAILALQEVFGDGNVRARGILTHDPTMIDICRQSFLNLQHVAHDAQLLST